MVLCWCEGGGREEGGSSVTTCSSISAARPGLELAPPCQFSELCCAELLLLPSNNIEAGSLILM